jgi:hypothetical protein
MSQSARILGLKIIWVRHDLALSNYLRRMSI